MIPYLLDECVPHAIAHGLRIRGVEAVTATDAGLITQTDEQVLRYALVHGYVLFSQDDDFLRLHSAGHQHGGIVYSKQGTHTLGQIIQQLKLLSDCLSLEEMHGEVEYF